MNREINEDCHQDARNALSRKTRLYLTAFALLQTISGLYGCVNASPEKAIATETVTPIPPAADTATVTATLTATETPTITPTRTPQATPTKSIEDLLKPHQQISVTLPPNRGNVWHCWQEGTATARVTFTEISFDNQIEGFFHLSEGLRNYGSYQNVYDQVFGVKTVYNESPGNGWSVILKEKPGQQRECQAALVNDSDEPVKANLQISGMALWCDPNYIYYRLGDGPDAIWQRCLRNPGDPSANLDLGKGSPVNLLGVYSPPSKP